MAWIRVVQQEKFGEFIEIIRRGETLSSKNSLTRLMLFVDSLSILRVGGRIRHSLLAYDEKHPMILPKDSRLTTLLIGSYHRKTLHSGVQQTLG